MAQERELAFRDRALDGVLRAARALKSCRAPSDVCGCGELIDEARRRAVPGATNCIHCAATLERVKRQYRSS